MDLFSVDDLQPINWIEFHGTSCSACGRRLSGGFGYAMPSEEPLCVASCAAYRRDMKLLGIKRPKTVAEKLAQAAVERERPRGPRR
ncbi:MAG: hypothetical protein AAGJ70_11810 [Pseudomonadota bacterium]